VATLAALYSGGQPDRLLTQAEEYQERAGRRESGTESGKGSRRFTATLGSGAEPVLSDDQSSDLSLEAIDLSEVCRLDGNPALRPKAFYLAVDRCKLADEIVQFHSGVSPRSRHQRCRCPVGAGAILNRRHLTSTSIGASGRIAAAGRHRS
jgi:hypothetical protein